MKVILTHEVSSLGSAGDVVEVKAGYARNFLFRRGLATAWTKGGQKQVDAIQADEALSAAAKEQKVAALREEWQQVHNTVLEAGGLHIIGSERHESRRIDNQLRGRAGRQGDAGSSRFYL